MNIDCTTQTIKTTNGVITRLGWVHEYTQGSGETALIASMKSVLNVLDPLKSASIESWACDKTIHFSAKASNTNVVRKLSEALDDLCVKGVYWGHPNANSNFWGFWPDNFVLGTMRHQLCRSGLENKVQVVAFGSAAYSSSIKSDSTHSFKLS